LTTQDTPTRPEGQPVGRVIAMPADTNPEGDIFGGWLLAQMDLAGATPAFERAQGRCATIALDGMVFHQPVSVGDEVSIYAKVIKTGRTSIRVHVEAWKRPRNHVGVDPVRVTEGVFTYVAIDADRKPRPLPVVDNADG
jgi:acyl-CoA thioesterase YciA